jgi:hypothetical protein
MDLSKLKKNVVTKAIEYGGETINIDILPDAHSSEDSELRVVDYVAKGLGGWDITDDGEAVEITSETLRTLIPAGLLTKIFDAILEVKEARVGKLKIVGK